jgi:hypothetical protein
MVMPKYVKICLNMSKYHLFLPAVYAAPAAATACNACSAKQQGTCFRRTASPITITGRLGK